MPNKLTYYNGGTTEHRLEQVYSGGLNGTRIFPSGMFLFSHESGNQVLYDTGLPVTMAGCGIRGRVYDRILPSVVRPEHNIADQLAADGIRPNDISHVVLSHLHPDHIGGVRHFPKSRFVVSEGIALTLQSSRLKDGVFPQLLPEWFQADKLDVKTDAQVGEVSPDSITGYDLFKDGSYVITQLPGHASGHLGAFVNESVLLAGDASWGNDLLSASRRLRLLPRAITDNYSKYVSTSDKLAQLAAQGIRVCFSHDTYHHKSLLNEA